MKLETPKIGLYCTHNIKTFDKDGKLVKEYPPEVNMITDAGMDQLGDNYYSEVTQYMHIGTDSTSNVREWLIASQSGTTVTSTSGTFEAADATNNRYIEFEDGSNAIIQSYTDANNVEVDISQTVTSQVAGIYKIETTALGAQLEADNNYSTDPGAINERTCTIDGDYKYLDYKRTHESSGSYPSGATVREIGLSVAGGDLFSRLVLSEAVTIPINGSMTNTHVLSVVLESSIKTLTSPITGVTGNATSRLAINLPENVTTAVSGINSDGTSNDPSNVNHFWSCEPCHYGDKNASNAPRIGVSNDVSALSVESTSGGTNAHWDNRFSANYVAGTFQRTLTTVITGSEFADTAWRTIAIRVNNVSSSSYDWRMLWDSDEVISVGNTLSVTVTKSWSRTRPPSA